MPRRKAKGEDQLPQDYTALPMLPPVRPSTHKHEHAEDPYKLPPGAVPGRAKVTTIASGPIEREMETDDKMRREIARVEQKEAGRRYEAFLDAMIEHGGDKRLALIAVYGEQEVLARGVDELYLDVRRGVGSTETGAILERYALDQNARARNLSRWMYSDNPAASLKASDMANEMAGDTGGEGTFESFLRISREQERLKHINQGRK